MRGLTIGGYRVGTLAKRTLSETWRDNVFGLSAEGAYNFFFSLFPLLLFLAPLLSFVGRKEAVVGTIVSRLAPLIPPDALSVIERALREVVFTENAPAIMSVGALLAAYTASNLIGVVSGGLNVAYGVKDERPWWRRRLMSVAIVIVAGIGIAVATGALLAGGTLVEWIAGALGRDPEESRIVTWVQYPVTFVVIVCVLWLMYYFLPATRLGKRSVLAGAVVAALLWIGVTLMFRLYVENFGAYTRTYGALGGIIVLLTWMYWTVFALLVGGELNAELHKGTGAVKPRRPVLFDGRIPAGEHQREPSA